MGLHRPRSLPGASVTPSASVNARARSGSMAPVRSRDPRQGDTEPGPFLFGEGHDRDRSAGPQSLLIEQVEGSKSRRQPEGTVESTPIGDRVEMASHSHDAAGIRYHP